LTLYLIDTNIVSRVSPTRHRTGDDEALAAWIEAHGDALYLSVVTVAEILDGIARARRQGATRKAAMLDDWWWELSHFWSSRILPVDSRHGRVDGQRAPFPALGHRFRQSACRPSRIADAKKAGCVGPPFSPVPLLRVSPPWRV
jgi:hypothetical protein